MHWNTGNTTRLWAQSPSELSKDIAQSLHGTNPPDAVILGTTPQESIIISPLIAPPLNIAFLYTPDKVAPDNLVDFISNLKPVGLTELDGAQVLLPDNTSQSILKAFRDKKLQIQTIPRDLGELALNISKLRQMVTKKTPTRFSLAPMDELSYALPLAAWSIRSGDPIFPATKDGLAKITSEFKGINLHVYLAGSTEGATDDLGPPSDNVRLKVISARNGIDYAIRLAQYYDPESNWGWRYLQSPEGWRNTMLTGVDNEELTLAALPIMSKGKAGPLLFTRPTRLSSQVESFLWSIKPEFWAAPQEGPWNHTWIIGDLNQISYANQGRVDFINEIDAYLSLGSQAVSGLEALTLVWLTLGVACSIWILIHSILRLPQMIWPMRIAWSLAGLTLGPLGLWAYVIAYQGFHPMQDPKMKMMMWKRPMPLQVLVSTMSSLGTGMAAMIGGAFLITYFGIPLFLTGDSYFFLGSPMTITVLGSYLLALILNGLIFMPAMLMLSRNKPYHHSFLEGRWPVFVSMTAAAMGMMPVMWWLMMEAFPVPPDEDQILWWSSALFSAPVGFLTAYIANWYLVQQGKKGGNM